MVGRKLPGSAEVGTAGPALTRVRLADALGEGPLVTPDVLATMLEALGNGVLLQDAANRVVLVNTAFLRLIGVSARPDELIGIRLDSSVADVGRLLAESGDGAHARTTEVRLESGRVVEREYRAVTDPDGRTTGHLWVLHDVTEAAGTRHRQAEQDRALAELSELRSEFIATVSHELRTPITSIVSLSTLLHEAGHLDPDQEACADGIGRNADRLLRLVDDLMLLVGLESHSLPMRDDPVEPIGLVREQIVAWSEPAAQAGAELRLEAVPGGPPLHGDEQTLGQMVGSLLGSALKVTPPGGVVTVAVRTEGDAWVIEVTDPSPGPSASAAQRLFTMYPDGAGEGGQGIGLGLLISRAIAERHNGTTTVGLSADGGTVVRVRIPQAGVTAHDLHQST